MSKIYTFKKCFCILFSFFLLSTINIAHSQTLSTSSNRLDYDKCGFEFKRNLFLTNNSNYQEALQQEKDIKKYTNNGQPKSNNILGAPSKY